MKLDRPLNKTEIVSDMLGKEIRSGILKPGSRLASMRELCDRFAVSIAVINSAYNTLEKQGLIERRIGSGTYVALPPEKRGKVFGFLTNIQSQFMPGYYDSIFEAGNESGNTILPQCLERGERALEGIDRLLAQNPAALLVDLEINGFELDAILERIGTTPVCFVNRYEWSSPLKERAVLVDYESIFSLALRNGAEEGHKKILYIGHEAEPWPFESLLLRNAAAQNPAVELCYACFNDFVTNVPRLKRIFETDEPPTLLTSRGDSVLLHFDIQIHTLYPQLKPLEKIGCFNTVWSHLPGAEFRSFSIDFKKIWQDAFELFEQPEKQVIRYMPQWPEMINSVNQ